MDLRKTWRLTQFVLQRLSMAIVIVLALFLTAFTVLATFGVMPWLEVQAQLNGETIENAGMYFQIAFTVLILLLAFFVPSAQRVMLLETSHRQFNLTMQDIAQAYATIHSADRAGAFRLANDFDAMRDRLSYLKEHPDLGELEPEVLELASEMSFVSRELAATYSNEKVERARTFLRTREEEIQRFNTLLSEARAGTQELSQWKSRLDIEESVVRSQLQEVKNLLHIVDRDLSASAVQLTGSSNSSQLAVPQIEKNQNG